MKISVLDNDNDYLRYKNQNSINFSVENSYSSSPFRVANFLHVMRGANDLKSLSYFSNHLEDKSDDGISLRGAYGPRMRNWIGPDQLQEAININMDVDDDEDFVKPKGIDQLRYVYYDLRDGIPESSIIIRNPGIDFDESNDIPDLLCSSFSKIDNMLLCNVTYGSIENQSNYINDIWVFNHICGMYSSWLNLDGFDMNVYSNRCSGVVDVDFFVGSQLDHFNRFGNDPDEFWKQMENLQHLQIHSRMMLNNKSFGNSEVSVVKLLDSLCSEIIDKVENEYLVDMCYVIMIGSLIKHDCANYEDEIMEFFELMKSPLKNEIASHMIRNGSFSLTNRDLIESYV